MWQIFKSLLILLMAVSLSAAPIAASAEAPCKHAEHVAGVAAVTSQTVQMLKSDHHRHSHNDAKCPCSCCISVSGIMSAAQESVALIANKAATFAFPPSPEHMGITISPLTGPPEILA